MRAQVKCQSDSVNARAVLAQLLAQGGPSALRALYAGFVSAALCSVLVGSVHYASFCVSKRMALQAAGAGSSDAGSSGGHGGGGDGANLVAATVGALATALVESPCELFRHQAQAGTVSGNFLREMVASVQKHVSAFAGAAGLGRAWPCWQQQGWSWGGCWHAHGNPAAAACACATAMPVTPIRAVRHHFCACASCLSLLISPRASGHSILGLCHSSWSRFRTTLRSWAPTAS